MYKILFIIIALFLIMLAVSKCKFTEGFANTPVAITSDNVADYIYTVYKADVKAIQNLADIAMKLQAGGIIVPGNMTVQNTLNVSSDSNLGGKLEVKGDSNLTGKLNVSGDSNLGGKLEVKGDSNLTGKLNVQNDSALNGISLTNNLSFNKGANKFIIYNGNPDNGGKDDGLYVHYYNPAWASRPLVIEKDTVTVGNLHVTGNITCDGVITFNNGSLIGPHLDGIGLWSKWRVNNQKGLPNVSVGQDTNTGIRVYTTHGDFGSFFWVDANLNTGVVYACDRRIKENIIDANSNDILNKINQLPMQNYNFNDKRYYDGNTVYGLIAQDVKEVFPEAVNITKHHIPNINKDVTSIVADGDTIVLTLEEFTVKVDDDLYLVVNDKPVFVKVLAFTDTTITVNKWKQYNANDKVSVYGTTTDDFHILNASYLGILSLGGIQELTKQNNELKARIEKLEKILTK